MLERYAVLEAAAVSKRYGGVLAVDDVTLALGGERIQGIIGPNGAGKSTLFNVLAGFTAPSKGTVRLDGRPLGGCSPAQRARLGIVRTFQELEVFPQLTVGEVLTAAALLRHPFRGARERASAMAVELDLPWDESSRSLGPGVLRRLELGRCLVAEPSIVLFDEVMAGLTPAESAFMIEAIERLHAFGVSVVIVEHMMDVVQRLCAEVVVLAQGRVIATGPTSRVTADPIVIEAYLGRRGTPAVPRA
ncbi:MAG: transporter related [Candidatus Eremiobacteraeota bacterium]|nr:transporter related [Candidatus Eremiobacteraeota bacterium]